MVGWKNTTSSAGFSLTPLASSQSTYAALKVSIAAVAVIQLDLDPARLCYLGQVAAADWYTIHGNCSSHANRAHPFCLARNRRSISVALYSECVCVRVYISCLMQ